jgi:hypothetical protein
MNPEAHLRTRFDPLRALGSALLLVGVLGIGLACDRQTTPTSSTVASSTTADVRGQIEDGNWDLKIDRAGRSEDPEEAFTFLPETYYHATEGGPTYHVVISLGGAQASIEGELADDTHFVVKGKRTSTADGHLWYELDGFAGGRFVVWSTAEGLEGELTWYGSGMPILFSHRGRLAEVP